MRIYLAGPLFSQTQRAWNRALAERITSSMPEATMVLPQTFRTEGKFNDSKHYGSLFRRCLEEITRADVLLAVLDGSDVDSGVAFEVGAAHAMGKVIVGLRTDYRPGAAHGVNLMVGKACRYMVREFAFQEDFSLVADAVVRRLRRIRAKGQ